HRHAVAAAVAVVGRVQGLMKVADQVHDPLERFVAIPGRGARVRQHDDQPLELLAVALPVGAVARLGDAAADRHVVVVPAGTCRRRAGDLVRPVGYRLERAASREPAELVHIAAQQLYNRGARLCAQQPVRDRADGAMPLASPRPGVRRTRPGDRQKPAQHVTLAQRRHGERQYSRSARRDSTPRPSCRLARLGACTATILETSTMIRPPRSIPWRALTPTVAVAGLQLATGALGAASPAATPAQSPHGVDLAGIDRLVAPGDDFFRYANGAWLKATEIPPDRSSYG